MADFMEEEPFDEPKKCDFMEEEHFDEPKKKKRKKSETKKPKKSETKSKADEDAVVEPWKKNTLGKILQSVSRPSITLQRGLARDIRSIRWDHRLRLQYLLRQLIRMQNWDEAAGVLSLFLKGTYNFNKINFDKLSANRIKYWATMKILEHMGGANLNPRKLFNVYELWLKKDFQATHQNRSFKGRLNVLLELILFCLSRGDVTTAYDNVISLQQESQFSKNALAMLVAGFTFSQRWYNSIQEELCLPDTVKPTSPMKSGISRALERMSMDQFNPQSVDEVQDSGSVFHQDSNTSVRFGKECVDQDRKVPMKVDQKLKQEIVENEEPNVNSYETDQNGSASRFQHTGNKVYGSIFYAHDLDDMLMPIKFQRTNSSDEFISLQKTIKNGHYNAAVKHFKNALHCNPPGFVALLPLIQMLLIGDQVKEAVEEVESVVKNSHASLPFRLKASLLEHFSKEDANKLSFCFEDILKRDPTCSQSLSKLIHLHHNGDYRIESLLEMIALHLDATYADSDIWKEFASCFLKLSQCDEDRMSTCGNSYGDSYTKFSKEIPDMFQTDVSKKNWKLRSRWWLTRHFSQTILASEKTSGNVELVVYKAASACHIYGSELAYVVSAYNYLKKEKCKEKFILKMHMQNAMGFTRRNTGSYCTQNTTTDSWANKSDM